jgi:two-component system OmpR family response regulator
MVRRILIIEDNRDLAALLKEHLTDLAFTVDLAHDGVSGLAKAEAAGYDLVILDLMLPRLDGMEICRRLRQQKHYTPILMLTAKSTAMDKILGLELGADDYVVKPFNMKELLARVKAILRRTDSMGQGGSEDEEGIVKRDDLVINAAKRTVYRDGKAVELTAKEFDLLLYFSRHPGRVYSRAQLLESVWGYDQEGYEHTVNSHINRLRAKLEIDPSNPRYIRTVWGVGYKFQEEE